MTRVLFVCLGNICRSPAAEAVARHKAGMLGLPFEFDSAGTGGWHIGDPPYGPMQAAASARGYDLSQLAARRFEPEDFTRFDLIIGMDARNLADLEAARPPGSGTPLALMTDFAPQTGAKEVGDPYYTREFSGTLDLIEICAEGLLNDLQNTAYR